MTKEPLQILVVEDDAVDRLTMKRALAASGIDHVLHFAEDHESGKIATLGREYDCIFLDYNLPGGTGLELLKAIRDTKNGSPIIIVTSQGDEKIAVEAMKNGANDYIPKSLLTAEGIGQSVRFMVQLKEKERRTQQLQNQLRETQKQLQTVVANSPIILFSLDRNANFTLFEGKGLNALGIDKAKFINQTVTPESGLPINIEDYKKAMLGEEVVTIVEMGINYFEVYYSPIYLGDNSQVMGVIGVASDITSHIQAEKELEKAKQLAEETVKIKEQFLANMSHEIRTPMNGIIGLTGILLNSHLDDEQLKYLQSIKTCSDNLLVIINDILDLSKIEAGKVLLENIPFRIADVVRHTTELFQAKADEKSLLLSLTVDPEIPIAIMGDPTRLNQVLNNLVSNAIKFTHEGEVSVWIGLRSKRADQVTIDFEVRDTGIGISEVGLESVFESFTQASSDTSRKYGGTGLGLTIVKRLIELQGGSIRVKSKPGKGSSFTFHLSFAIAKENQIHESPQGDRENYSISDLRILAADDNPVNRIILKKLFSDWQTFVEFAENGRYALEKLKASDFDIILMDMQMPEMDGYTATTKIRNEFPESKKNIPIIAITAHATSTERKKCINLGMNEYISKPFDPFELKKKIYALTKTSQPPLNGKPVPSVSSPEQVLPGARENEIEKPSTLLPADDRTSLQTKNLVIENASYNFDAGVDSQHKINLSYLVSIAEGSDTFLIEMIEVFLNKTPQAVEKMNECFKQQNWEELRQIAHRIRPSYGYIGMKKSQNLLAEIETLSESVSDPEKMGILLHEVELASREAYVQLQKELGGLR